MDKPGVRALEAMKNLNKTVSIFKIPKIPQKKEDKMKILTEERYIEVRLFELIVFHALLNFLSVYNCRSLAKLFKKIFSPTWKSLRHKISIWMQLKRMM